MPLLHAAYTNLVDGWCQTYCTGNGSTTLDVFERDPWDTLTAYVDSSGPTAAYRKTGESGESRCAAPTAAATTTPSTTHNNSLMSLS
jgi:hypothetical protein